MPLPVALVLDLCTVRSFRQDDAASIARHADNRNVWINLLDRFPHPYTLADAQAWLDRVSAMSRETHFAIAVEGPAIGAIGFDVKDDVFRRSADIGYWLGEEFWGRGIATAALRAVSDYAFANFDLCRIEAGVFEWNAASMRVLEKAGYVREGRLRRRATKDGRTIDQLVYALIRDA